MQYPVINPTANPIRAIPEKIANPASCSSNAGHDVGLHCAANSTHPAPCNIFVNRRVLGERLAVASASIISSGSVAYLSIVMSGAAIARPPRLVDWQTFKVPENGTRAGSNNLFDAISRALLVVRSIVLT
jgi:hypothetical protein